MTRLTHLSLFSGIGGLDLAAEWAGFTTVGQCEMADFPTKILEKHWPNVPRWRDIRTLTKESFHERTGLRTVDIISGGFPCQPFSVAGKQKGKGDDRYLWPEMRRVISELEPRWVVGENVPGILRIAAADVVQDLERIGYHVVLLDFEAASVGAPHHRERIAFVANRDSQRLQGRVGKELQERTSEWVAGEGSAFLFDTASTGLERSERKSTKRPDVRSANGNRWPAEPDVGRVAHGVPHRVDRIKGLGNAVCPPQFYPIFKAIAEWEEAQHAQRP